MLHVKHGINGGWWSRTDFQCPYSSRSISASSLHHQPASPSMFRRLRQFARCNITTGRTPWQVKETGFCSPIGPMSPFCFLKRLTLTTAVVFALRKNCRGSLKKRKINSGNFNSDSSSRGSPSHFFLPNQWCRNNWQLRWRLRFLRVINLVLTKKIPSRYIFRE